MRAHKTESPRGCGRHPRKADPRRLRYAGAFDGNDAVFTKTAIRKAIHLSHRNGALAAMRPTKDDKEHRRHARGVATVSPSKSGGIRARR